MEKYTHTFTPAARFCCDLVDKEIFWLQQGNVFTLHGAEGGIIQAQSGATEKNV